MSDKSIEEREEQRIMRAFQAGGAKKPFKVASDDGVHVPALVNKAPTTATSPRAAATSTAAPAAAENPVSPRAAGGVPQWKLRQQQAEQETRERLEREALEKQAAIEAAKHAKHSANDDVVGLVSPRLTDEDRKQERILVSYMKNAPGVDVDTANRAAEAERERLETIFKAKPVVNKQRFAGISEQAKANMANADAARAEEEKRADAAAAALKDKVAQLTAQRVAMSQSRTRDADAHYASADAALLHVNELERNIIREIEQLRADPRNYVAKLRVRRECYEGGVLTLQDPSGGPSLRIKTSDGVAAVDEAIALLQRTSPAPIVVESALVRCMYNAVKEDGQRPNAVANVAKYGKVSGSARQIVYRGPVLDAIDIVTAILTDDGQADRSRRDALLADKFKHFGVAASVDEKGAFNYCYLLMLSNFEANE